MSARILFGAAATLALLGTQSHAVTLGFDDGSFVEGQVLDSTGAFSFGGTTVSIFSEDTANQPVILFDTNCDGINPGFESNPCSGNDTDLSSAFPASSNSDDPAPLTAGLALVLSNDPLSAADTSGSVPVIANPNDDAGGGKIILEFGDPVVFTGFNALDVEEGAALNVSGFLGSTETSILTGLTVDADGQHVRQDFLAPGLFDKLVFRFAGSGGIDNISFDTQFSREVPLPGALPMLLGGLGLMSWLGWRRRTA